MVEWPLYGVLSILILLTAAMLRILLLYHPLSQLYPIPEGIRGSPLNRPSYMQRLSYIPKTKYISFYPTGEARVRRFLARAVGILLTVQAASSVSMPLLQAVLRFSFTYQNRLELSTPQSDVCRSLVTRSCDFFLFWLGTHFPLALYT